VRCNRCDRPAAFDLSGVHVEDSYKRARCAKCAQILSIGLRPCLVHAESWALCYLDSSTCIVSDVLSVSLRASCLECLDDLETQPAVRAARREAACRHCHKKVAFTVRSFVVEPLAGSAEPTGGALKRQASNAERARARQPQLTEGTPLPDSGACAHFGKSLRWLRFPCCGRAYPCPVCHELDGGANEACLSSVRATRMICGRCSREQNISSKPCEGCGFAMARKAGGGGHWEGGGGSRNTAQLSRKDARKGKGASRDGVAKTASKKAQRVGAAGKKARGDKSAV